MPNSNNYQLTFMLYNPRSLNNKLSKVISYLQDKSIDIAGICESWLRNANCPTTATLKKHGFNIIHQHRDDKRGGGTALIYNANLTLTPVSFSKTDFKNFEFTSAMAKTKTSSKLLFIIVYRTEHLTSNFNSEMDELLAEAIYKCDVLIVAGDFNIHFNKSDGKGLIHQTLNTFKSFGLKKHIEEPTHVNGGSLDQIFTYTLNKNIEFSFSVDVENVIGSDHFPVICNMNIPLAKKHHKSITYRNIKGINKEIFSTQLQDTVSMHLNRQFGNFNELYNSFSSASLAILNDHAPIIRKNISTVVTAPWFDKEYRNLRKLRRKAEAKWGRTGNIFDRIDYKDLCHKCSELSDVKKKKHFGELIERSNNNPRALFSLVNKELDRNQGKPLPDFTDDLCQLTNKFNKFFSEKIDSIRATMTTAGTPADLLEFDSKTLPVLSELKPTDINEIRDILNETGYKCSPADPLPSSIFKEHSEMLLPILVQLVNSSLESGNFDGLKLADIAPLLKGCSLDPNILSNYRPVSNLLFVGKVIERVVLRRLNSHLDNCNLNCPQQSAYKKNHSTETLLIKITNDVLIASDERTATVVMLLDLSAAFDTVDHDLLLKILYKEIGIKGNALSWFQSFLKGRSQRIRLGVKTSETIFIRFGVPQGSVLGPVLFNIYIRSIYRCVNNLGFKIEGYADDHQVMKSFRSFEQLDVLKFQLINCFQTIKSWMNKYFLKMNDQKTQIIVFGPSKTLHEIILNGVNISSDTTVRFVSTVKNLGVYMDQGLSMNDQVIKLKKKCFSSLRNISRIRFLLTKDQLKLIVNSFVISCLDYCNGIYYGVSEYVIRQIQLIQNAAVKLVTGKYKYDHVGNDLNQLHWLPIKKRIIFKLALLSFKSLNGLSPPYLQQMFHYSHHGHTLQLSIPPTNLKVGRRSFSVAGPRIFNLLPLQVKSSDTVNIFKARLKTHLFELSEYEIDKLWVL